MSCARVSAALLAGACAFGTQSAHAQQLRFSPDRLARLDRALQAYVDSGHIAGAATLVLHGGKSVHEGAYGWADKESGRRMTTDAIFRIASQTKAVTSVAVMMLVEEGRLSLADRVSLYMPTFARTVIAGRTDTGMALVPARRAITIRDLLTHTAGISYGRDSLVAPVYQAKGLGTAAGYGWYTADKAEPICETMDRLGTLPFVAQPGEGFVYGYSTDILGCVVERVSGMSLDEFFRQRIFEPLGMRDTYFYLPPEKRNRLATVYSSDPSGKLSRAGPGPRGQGDYLDGPRRSFSGGAGLVSTTRDYGRFLQMMLNGGELNGVRLLSPTTVRLMTTNVVGTLFGTDGFGFGLGFETYDRPGAGARYPSVGSFGWGGAYQSAYLVDPEQDLVLVFMSQHLPNAPFNIRDRFTAAVYQALVPE